MSQEMPGDTAKRMASAKGVVLDIGPGNGAIVRCFNPESNTKLYGVEPAVDMHPELGARAKEAGFGDKYEIIAAGAEPMSLVPALAKMNLIKTGDGMEGLFDTIVCVRSLCGVPDQVLTIELLYRCLKPGGRMIISEHVVNPWPNSGSIWGKFFQRFYTLIGWQLWMGCYLERDTREVLRKVAGKDGWRKFDLTEYGSWAPVPFIVGEVIKK
jgi:SAM-dependent methyltransferase